MTETTMEEVAVSMFTKVADILEKTTVQYGDDVVNLTLEVGRMAAIKQVAKGVVSFIVTGLLCAVVWKLVKVIKQERKKDNSDFLNEGIFWPGLIGAGVSRNSGWLRRNLHLAARRTPCMGRGIQS